jgi:Domain of unknown function (DUF6285)
MNDRPTAGELVAAVRQFLEAELLPTLADPRLRFQALVAANVLTIAERELLTEEDHLREEWQRLVEVAAVSGPAPERLAALRQAVREGNEHLCEQIRRGAFDDAPRFADLCRRLRQTVERKLEVANPRYLSSFRAGGA